MISGFFNMPLNLSTLDRRLYFPSEGSRATDFVAIKNPSSSAGFQPANFGSSGKHDNHYTTDGGKRWKRIEEP
jgi:hypothetical protein